jgi:hypothetical protein
MMQSPIRLLLTFATSTALLGGCQPSSEQDPPSSSGGQRNPIVASPPNGSTTYEIPRSRAFVRGDLGPIHGIESAPTTVVQAIGTLSAPGTVELTIENKDRFAIVLFHFRGLYADSRTAPSGVYKTSFVAPHAGPEVDGSLVDLDGSESALSVTPQDNIEVSLSSGPNADAITWDTMGDSLVIEIEDAVEEAVDGWSCSGCGGVAISNVRSVTRRVTFIASSHAVDGAGVLQPSFVTGMFFLSGALDAN